MQKLTVLVDMDGILVDLTTYWLSHIYEEHDILVGIDEIDQWSLHKCGGLVSLKPTQVYAYLQQPGFFRHAPALPGAIEGLRKLNDLYNVVIVSSPSGPISAKEKYEWLAEHAPFLKLDQIILANQKTLVRGDVLIDDHPETGVKYRAAWPGSMVLGIEYEYNKNMAQEKYWVRMFKGYEDTSAAWVQIVDAVAEHAQITADLRALADERLAAIYSANAATSKT